MRAVDRLKNEAEAQIPWLDGVRGFASFWVLASHVQILTGMHGIALLSWGDLAVDLFMLLSGFLMAHHYALRQPTEPWERRSTALFFWIRRYFRIAPLYYVLLFIALLVGPTVGEFREAIAAVWPQTATDPGRYNDAGIANIFTHLSFMFGALPHYSFRTPLPDWSIGLEMQFYLVFPLIMLLVARFGPVRTGLAAILFCLILKFFFRDFFHGFEMPSFLPMKLYVFFIGIWLALGRLNRSMKPMLVVSILVAAAMAVVFRSPQSIAFVVLVLGMFYLLDIGDLPTHAVIDRIVAQIRGWLSGRVARFLGDTSYSVYLLHLLLLIPIAGTLCTYQWFLALNGAFRFLTCLGIVYPMVCVLAWPLHRYIEMSGIRIGKTLIKKYFSRISA